MHVNTQLAQTSHDRTHDVVGRAVRRVGQQMHTAAAFGRTPPGDAMNRNTTRFTDAGVDDCLASRGNAQPQADCRMLIEMRRVTNGDAPRMWGQASSATALNATPTPTGEAATCRWPRSPSGVGTWCCIWPATSRRSRRCWHDWERTCGASRACTCVNCRIWTCPCWNGRRPRGGCGADTQGLTPVLKGGRSRHATRAVENSAPGADPQARCSPIGRAQA